MLREYQNIFPQRYHHGLKPERCQQYKLNQWSLLPGHNELQAINKNHIPTFWDVVIMINLYINDNTKENFDLLTEHSTWDQKDIHCT